MIKKNQILMLSVLLLNSTAYSMEATTPDKVPQSAAERRAYWAKKKGELEAEEKRVVESAKQRGDELIAKTREQVRKDQEMLKEMHSNSEKFLKDTEKEVDEFYESLSNLQSKLSVNMEAIKKSNSPEGQDAKKKLGEATKMLEDINNRVKALKQDQEQKEQEVQELQTEKQRLEERLKKNEAALQDETGDKEKLKEENGELKSTLSEKSKQIELREKNNQDLRETILKLDAKNKESRRLYIQATVDFGSEVSVIQDEVNFLKDENEVFFNRAERLKNENQELKKEEQQLQQEKQVLEQKLQEKIKIEEELKHARESYDVLESDYKNRETELGELRQERENLNNSLAKLGKNEEEALGVLEQIFSGKVTLITLSAWEQMQDLMEKYKKEQVEIEAERDLYKNELNKYKAALKDIVTVSARAASGSVFEGEINTALKNSRLTRDIVKSDLSVLVKKEVEKKQKTPPKKEEGSSEEKTSQSETTTTTPPKRLSFGEKS